VARGQIGAPPSNPPTFPSQGRVAYRETASPLQTLGSPPSPGAAVISWELASYTLDRVCCRGPLTAPSLDLVDCSGTLTAPSLDLVDCSGTLTAPSLDLVDCRDTCSSCRVPVLLWEWGPVITLAPTSVQGTVFSYFKENPVFPCLSDPGGRM
jgi:hypothetical protein